MSLVLGSDAQEEALIPLSALQHFLFCPRQCALIHVEQLWAEDAATADGKIFHEMADSGQLERRRGVKILRANTALFHIECKRQGRCSRTAWRCSISCRV